MSTLQLMQLFGRISTRIGESCLKFTVTSLLGKFKMVLPIQNAVTRLTSVSIGTIVASSGLLSCAYAAQGQNGKQQNQQEGQVGREWIANRVKGDICHLAPGISELMLDVLDLLQERYDKYISSMSRRISDLENNLRKYGSTLSLDTIGNDNASLTDPGTAEIQQFRKEYRTTYQRSTDMMSGLDRFLLSAGQLGANTCVEKCQREMQEICGLLDNLEHKIRDYENKLTMAEKHFRTKMRRTAGSPANGLPSLPK